MARHIATETHFVGSWDLAEHSGGIRRNDPAVMYPAPGESDFGTIDSGTNCQSVPICVILGVMRAALNISLPESMRSWVDEQVERSGFGTASEFIRALIRDAQAREARERIDAKLRSAMQSEAKEMTADDWKDVERRVFEVPKKTRRKR